jgi:hypothetical protein
LQLSQQGFTGNSFDSDVQSESVTTFIIPVNQGTSANEIKENAGNLYYSDGTIYTNFPNVNTISISIYNIAGQFIETNNQVPGQGSCQFNLTKGIYLIYTIVNNSKIIEKIVVSN